MRAWSRKENEAKKKSSLRSFKVGTQFVNLCSSAKFFFFFSAVLSSFTAVTGEVTTADHY